MTRLSNSDKITIATALINELTYLGAYDPGAASSSAIALRKLNLSAENIADITIASGERATWLCTPGYELGYGDYPNIPNYLATQSANGFADPYVEAVAEALRAKTPQPIQHSAQIIAFPTSGCHA